MQELEKTLKQLKNGRCEDKAGIVAEMLKHGGAALKKALLCLDNEIIKPDAATPTQWKQTQIIEYITTTFS